MNQEQRVPNDSPQARKLGLKPGHRVSLVNQPPRWVLESPPAGICYVEPTAAADIVIFFAAGAHDLAAALPALAQRIFPGGSLWIAWPRRAAGHHSDITDTIIRDHALTLGVVDNKVAAIDPDWSGLRLVWRVGNRR